MELLPIISAMRHNKVGAILITLQMSVTLAILCNGLFIVQQRIAWSQRPTGVMEATVFTMANQWVGTPPDLAARLQTDLSALRGLPGVVDAYSSNSFPLADGGESDGCDLKPDQLNSSSFCAVYTADEHGVNTLGLNLIAGRDFTAAEVTDHDPTDTRGAAVVVITRELAAKLFPGESAIDQTFYLEGRKERCRVIGVVDRLQVPWPRSGAWGSGFAENSIIEPFRYLGQGYFYVVRTQPGRTDAVLLAAQKKLYELNRARVLRKVRTMTQSRDLAYKDDRGLIVVLAVVCTALLAVTAFGIVGLTSYWVTQRRRQIGIRRALGATRGAIMQYFQLENFLIAVAGTGIGAGLALAINLWMVNSFEMERLHLSYTVIGAVVVLLLGQLAVLWPALRAASVPPALATRAS